jgi:hypothetical protein
MHLQSENKQYRAISFSLGFLPTVVGHVVDLSVCVCSSPQTMMLKKTLQYYIALSLALFIPDWKNPNGESVMRKN